MKTNVLMSLVLLACSTFLMSCDKDDDTLEVQSSISTEEAVDMVEGALATTSEGVTQAALDAVEVAEDLDNFSDQGEVVGRSECGETMDSTITRSRSTDRISAEYSLSWQWITTCNDRNLPVELAFSRTLSGTYETPRMSSNDSASGDWVVENLGIAGTEYVLNGSYERNGSQSFKVRDKNSFTSLIRVEVTNLEVNKGSLQITSGTGEFRITGEDGNGNSFEVTGTIIFTGNQTATLTINGEVYELEW